MCLGIKTLKPYNYFGVVHWASRVFLHLLPSVFLPICLSVCLSLVVCYFSDTFLLQTSRFWTCFISVSLDRPKLFFGRAWLLYVNNRFFSSSSKLLIVFPNLVVQSRYFLKVLTSLVKVSKCKNHISKVFLFFKTREVNKNPDANCKRFFIIDEGGENCFFWKAHPIFGQNSREYTTSIQND